MPDEWVDFCRATARPPAIEVRMQRLRELRKEPEALAGKLHAMFKLLYITKWRLWYRPSSSHLVLFLLGSCCLDDDSFLPQYKIGARINPFIFLGRITVLNEMYEKGKLIAAIDERAAKDGWRRLSEDEEQEMQELEKDLDTLPLYVHGTPGDRGYQTPAQYLSSVGHLCMTVAKDDMAPPAVTVADPSQHGPGVLLIDGKPITQQLWRTAIHQMELEACGCYLELVAGDEEALDLLCRQAGPMQQRPLSHDLRAAGHSLLDGPDSFEGFDLKAIAARIVEKKFYFTDTSSGARVMDAASMNRFLGQRNGFQEYLITLLHITGGQPGRATELAALTWRDQANGRRRDLYMQGGTLVVAPSYNKSSTVRAIARFPDAVTAALLVAYLAILERLTVFVWERLHPPDRGVVDGGGATAPGVPAPLPLHDPRAAHRGRRRARRLRAQDEAIPQGVARLQGVPAGVQGHRAQLHAGLDRRVRGALLRRLWG